MITSSPGLHAGQDRGHFQRSRARVREKRLLGADALLEPGVALLRELPVTRQVPDGMGLGDVPELLAGHVGLVEWDVHGRVRKGWECPRQAPTDLQTVQTLASRCAIPGERRPRPVANRLLSKYRAQSLRRGGAPTPGIGDAGSQIRRRLLGGRAASTGACARTWRRERAPCQCVHATMMRRADVAHRRFFFS